jgi:hypothetical protein
MKRRYNHRAPSKKNRDGRSTARNQGSMRTNRSLRFEAMEPRELLAVGPQLIGINPNLGEILQHGEVRHLAPQELTFRFDESQVINAATLGGIQIVRSGFDGAFGNGNDVAITPGYIGIGERPNEVVFRFADALPDDKYRITIVGAGATPLRNMAGEAFNNGANKTVDFELDLGARIIAVVPQPVTRGAGNVLTQARNQIEVYFNNDDLHPTALLTGQVTPNPTVVDPRFYQLIYTNDSATNTDDQIFLPMSVSYDPATDKAVLTFATDLAQLTSGPGTYRLRIGTDEVLPQAPVSVTPSQDAGSSGSTAYPLNTLSASMIVNGAISPELFPLEFPGANDEPGHRDITAQNHFLGLADASPGITQYYYNFKSIYGTDPQGNALSNLITTAQKELTRRIFEMYSYYIGAQFIETESSGLTIVTGDMRALQPTIPTGPGGVAGLAGNGMAIMDNAEDWNDTFGGNWFNVAMHEIGHLLGLGHTYEAPILTVMGSDASLGGTGEPVYPGDYDILHGRYLHRPEGNDIDLYSFTVTQAGVFSAETIAERLANSSTLDTVLSLYRSAGDRLELIARNDDYFGEDSFLEMVLTPGQYVIGISSSGNRGFDANSEDTGLNGTSDGPYQLRVNLRPLEHRVIVDATGTALDGDSDDVPGGEYNFWFRAQTLANTLFVDKAALGGATANGSLERPYRTIQEAFAAAKYGDIVRLVANGGTDNNVATVANNLPFKIGLDELQRPLEDGATVKVPRGVTLMIDAGTVFKAQKGAIEVGSTAAGVDRSGGALQVLGTPTLPVYFTSYNDETIGRDTNPNIPQTPAAGDWGGIIFRNDLDRATPSRIDYEARGIFLNYVNHADIRYGGGRLLIDSRDQTVAPIHMLDARPAITHNSIRFSADAAISATPDSFEETNFHAPRFQTVAFTSDYTRVGPDIYGNALFNNTINGLFIRIKTPAGDALRPMTVSGRFDDTDIVHVLTENLVIQGQPGGPKRNSKTGQLESRLDARLRIDPGTVVKLYQALIQVDVGAQLIAEGIDGRNVIFTSLRDDTYGTAGNFDTSSDGLTAGAAGDWGGLYFGHVSTGSVDYARVRYAGGIAKLQSQFAGFNPIEIHQADVRVAHSIFEYNAQGTGGQAPANRFGLLANAAGTIFVRGAQPVIAENIIRHNVGPAININANALNSELVRDFGRSTGTVGLIADTGDNYGPLVRDNRLLNNGVNGMVVRGNILTTASVWDDTSIAHVLFNEVIIPDYHSSGGLRLESSPGQSLVVKLWGPTAGFTAAGRPIDIDDRIGGILLVLGQPGAPVVLTSLRDDTVAAGVMPDGTPLSDTNNDGSATAPAPGDWRSVRLDAYSHDRNVAVHLEREGTDLVAPGANGIPDTAEYIGALAPHEHAGDDHRRLGFQVIGSIAQPSDVDVYSFMAAAGTEVWIDIDRSSQALDTVIELVDRNGNVIARSNNSYDESQDPSLLVGGALLMQKLPPFGGRDYFGVNPKDAGMRVILPDSAGTTNLYYIRVRSSSNNLNLLDAGVTTGVYELHVRLRETDELPGSNVRFADVRYATNGIEVLGMPIHSPLTGEASESPAANDNQAAAQFIGNLLVSDRAALGVSGNLTLNDVDFYRFDVVYTGLQGPTGGPQALPYAGAVFDIDYADGLARGNITLTIFDSAGRIVLVSNDSNIRDDRSATANADMDDLLRGSLGPLDPFLGTVALPAGTYYVAVSAASRISQQLEQYFVRDAVNPLLRLEPINSILRIAEDHIGSSGGSTAAQPVVPVLLDNTRVVPYALNDLVLFVTQDEPANNVSRLLAINPFTGAIEVVHTTYGSDVGDLALRHDTEYAGRLFSFSTDTEDGNPTDAEAGNLIQIDPGTGAFTLIGDDGIVTFELNPAGDSIIARDTGVHFEAMTFGDIGQQLRLLAIGYRGDMNETGPNGPRAPRGVAYTENILYRFDPNTGAVLGVDDPNEPRVAGAGTDTFERGVILTQTTITAAAGAALADGRTFTINDGNTITVFEFDTGPAATVNFNQAQGQRVTDQESFSLTVNNVLHVFQFSTGPIINITGNGATLGNQVISIQDDQGRTRTFTLDAAANNPTQLAALLVTAINAEADFNVVAANIGGRVSLQNDLSVDLGAPQAGLELIGQYGLPPGSTANLVPIEETFTPQQVRAAIVAAVNAANIATTTGANPTITASTNGQIVYFSGAEAANFDGCNDMTALATAVGGTLNPDATAVPFLISDTAIQIAQRIAAAINNTLTSTVVATASGVNVALLGLFDAPRATADAPLTVAGAGPGGRITGMAILNNEVYCVSDTGGLWRIDNPLSRNPVSVYIGTSSADLVGIQFAGLTAGPSNVEGGMYSDMLFGMSSDGTLYAFGTDGVLRPVFVNGATSVQMFHDNSFALPQGFQFRPVQGLAFSSLDTNMWHTSDRRQGDAGHGVNTTFDYTREAANGGLSFYFGREEAGNYNTPGGAHGVLVTNEFDLSAYTAADLPMLYFNYLAITEEANGNGMGGNPPMRDSFRVYASAANGQWQLLGTNNTFRGAGDADDEYDARGGVQELFDFQNPADGDWRQARVPLSDFAGQSGIRLRFEFDTGGSMRLGHINSAGAELRAVAGAKLRDGDTFAIGGITFEFDLGYTVEMPSGALIAEGDRVTVAGQSTTTIFEFSNSGLMGGSIAVPAGAVILDGQTFSINDGLQVYEFVFNDTAALLTPEQIAESLAQIINASGMNLTAVVSGHMIHLHGDAVTLIPGTAPLQMTAHIAIPFAATDTPALLASRLALALTTSGPLDVTPRINTLDGGRLNLQNATYAAVTSGNIRLEGQPGATNGVRIAVHEAMTSNEVATAMREIVAAHLAGFTSQILMQSGEFLAEGQTITVSNGTQTYVLEFDSGYTLALPPNAGAGLADGDTIEVAVTDPVDLSVTTHLFELDSGYSILVPAGGGNPTTGLNDGDTFTITHLGTPVQFRFTKGPGDPLVNTDLPITDLSSQEEVARLIVLAITNAGIGLSPVYLGNGEIQVGGTSDHTLDTAGSPLTQAGQPGAQNAGATVIAFSRGMSWRALGTTIAAAIAGSGVGLDAAQYLGGGRIHLGGTVNHAITVAGGLTLSGLPGAQTPDAITVPIIPGGVFTAEQAATNLAAAINAANIGIAATTDGRRVKLLGEGVVVDTGTTGLLVDGTPLDVVKRFEDVLRIIGRTVDTPGKLLLANDLWSDDFGAPNRPARAQANNYEGVYIDDLIIGFAERGEMATGSIINTTFRANPQLPANQILAGLYQLEIRRAMEHGEAVIPAGNIHYSLLQSFDTNDRLTQAVTLTASSGANLYDGQSFTIGDGINDVTFVFRDSGARLVDSGNVISTATNTNLTAGTPGTYRANGGIGAGDDVDFFALDLAAGDTITIDIDQMGASALDSVLRVFNSLGVQQAINDDGPAPGESITRESYIEFTATAAGRYYVEVSGYQSFAYDPDTDTWALIGSTGDYQIEILLNGGTDDTGVFVIPYSRTDTAAQVANAMALAFNQEAVQAILDIQAISNPQGARVDLSGPIVVTAGSAPNVREPNDSMATATQTGIASDGAGAYRARGTIGDGQYVGRDVDLFELRLLAGQTITVDIDARIQGSPLDSYLRLFDAYGIQLAYSNDNNAPGEPAVGVDSYLSFTAPYDGVYYVGVSGLTNSIYTYNPATPGSGMLGSTGWYEMTISRDGAAPAQLQATYFTGTGDSNRFRDQGQILIESSFVTHSLEYGIVVDAAPRDATSDAPHQGPVRVLVKANTDRLVPGTTVANNVVAFNGLGGIRFSGDTTGANSQYAPVPYGRIINNTLYGSETANATTGITIDHSASPTVLNNIIAGFGLGLSVDASSQTSVVGGLLFQGNTVNSNAGLGDHAITLTPSEPLFVNPAAGNFYLDHDSRAIDSAVMSLEDRSMLIQVREPLGIANAPVLAPETDVFGLLRADNPFVTTPGGLGENVFIDRGAIDRIDYEGPTAILITPPDGDGDTFAQSAEPLRDLIIQLNDAGLGVDDATVDGSKIVVTRDGVLLVEGVDYTFRYDSTNNWIRLTAGSGVFPAGDYHILLDNSAATGIRDLANNRLQPNRLTGIVEFLVDLGSGTDWGDAPASYSTSRPDGANHAIKPNFYLGYGVDPDSDGQPSSLANADLYDDGVTFNSAVLVSGQSQVTIRASAAGRLDAWIDFNRDGVWTANEKIFDNVVLVAGENVLTFSTPVGANAAAGESFARFRFSSTGGLLPNGPATDGEVEDYRVNIVGAIWQNPNNRLDVNNDGVVSPHDALLLANFLYFNGSQPLPTGVGTSPFPEAPPPYYDVNGDNLLTPHDALIVIAYLRNPTTTPTAAYSDPAPEVTPTADAPMAMVQTTAPAAELEPETAQYEPPVVWKDPLPLGAMMTTEIVYASVTPTAAPSIDGPTDFIYAESLAADEEEGLVLTAAHVDQWISGPEAMTGLVEAPSLGAPALHDRYALEHYFADFGDLAEDDDLQLSARSSSDRWSLSASARRRLL